MPERATESTATTRAQQRLAELPRLFAENRGQWREDIRFAAQNGASSLVLTDQGIRINARVGTKGERDEWYGVALSFAASLPRRSTPVGEGRMRGIHHYLLGNDASKWTHDVALYESVRYPDVAPGVDIVVGERDGKIAYDLHVEPGADLSAVELRCDGVDSIGITPEGQLELRTPVGSLTQTAPKAWCISESGESAPVACEFLVKGDKSYGFAACGVTEGSTLIVDPSLDWSTYLGSADTDQVTGIAELNGFVTVTGWTVKPSPGFVDDFPVTPGAFMQTRVDLKDVFVTRFDPNQTGTAQLVWSTYLGGSLDEEARGLALTSSGNVAVCGFTYSSNFPTFSAYQSTKPTPTSTEDAFVSYLDSTGSSLLYGTYFGNTTPVVNFSTVAHAIAIDATPIITITGATRASGLVLANGYDPNHDGPGMWDAYVAQFDPAAASGSLPVYSTYVGGNVSATQDDVAYAVAIEGPFVCIAGKTDSAGFDINGLRTAYQNIFGGGTDAFVTVIRPNMPPTSQFIYASFLGGAAFDSAYGVDLAAGVMYVCGETTSTAFPVSGFGPNFEAPAFQNQLNGPSDAFALKLDSSMTTTQLRYSTYLGGSSTDSARAVVRAQSQAIVLTGGTFSADFPTSGAAGTNAPYDSTYNTNQDAFLTRLFWKNGRIGLAQLHDSTYFGASFDDFATCVALTQTSVYFGGYTSSLNFPTSPTPFDASLYNTSTGNSYDAFASCMSLGALPIF